MNGRPLTDAQISQALRAHLPEAAAPGLRERVFEAAETTSQLRALPLFLGALSDADPVGRRRSLLIAAAILVARNYPFGTALRMGPGFFPVVLGGLLIVFGLTILALGLRQGESMAGSWSLRALIILPLSLVLFGLLMEYAGFVPAMLVLIFGSATASTEFRFVEVLLFSIGLTALSVAVFVWALGLPYPLIVGLD